MSTTSLDNGRKKAGEIVNCVPRKKREAKGWTLNKWFENTLIVVQKEREKETLPRIKQGLKGMQS